MHNKYITLFKELAQAIAASAETVMDYNREKNDDNGLKTATIMRDDYQELTSRIKDAGDGYLPTKSDIARLTVGTMIIVNQLQDQINTRKKAITGYQTDIIPKLQKILDTATDDDSAKQMAEESFVIKDND